MVTFFQDCRYALRALAKAPGLTAIALLTMGIGIGTNATVFSFVNALLLRPAPGVANAASLVSVFTSDYSSTPYGESSYPDYQSLKSDASAFLSMAAYQDDATAVIRVGETVERVHVMRVSGEYFDVLGLAAAAGRLLSTSDTEPAASPAAVISHRFWRRAFDGHPAVTGTTIKVAGQVHTIVGVAPSRFEGVDLGRAFDVWVPLVPPAAAPEERGNRGLGIIGRLRPGSRRAEAQAQVSAIAERLAREYPSTNRGTLQAPGAARPMYVLRHTRIHPQFRGDVMMLGGVIMTAVGIVLLIACTNVASLLLSRATSRNRELAIRLALGAARSRLVRQLLTESFVLATAGGAAGLLFALWTADALPSFFPAEQARMLDASLDARVLAFVAGISLLSSLLFGTLPALVGTRAGAIAALRDTGGISDGRLGTRLRRGLVTAQIALAVVLLISASLLVQSLSNSLRVDLGFGTREAVLASVELPLTDFSPAQGAAYYEAALARLRATPGIEAASLVRTLPLSGGPRRGFRIQDYHPRPGEDMELHFNVVSAGYFETMKGALLSGRTFDERVRTGTTPVAIVNDALANRYFAGNAVGRQLTDSAGQVLQIIGVVRSGKYRTPQEAELPTVYYPLTQSYSPRMTAVARTAGDAAGFTELVRRTLREVDADVAIFRTTTLNAHVEEALTGERLIATLVGVCAGMALVLAIVGIYGIVAYAALRRTREFAVRLALGAPPRHIVSLILGEGLGVTAGGVAIGLLTSAVAGPLLATMLYGIAPTDGATYIAASAVLALVAIIAAGAPAHRALHVDPVTVLREN